jgi:hypothetical protein
VICLNVFHILARKPNLEKMSIYSNKFFHNFHLSKSSFTCPGLRASGLVWKLVMYMWSKISIHVYFRELEYQILMLKDAFFTSFSLIAEGGFQLSTFHIYSNIPAAQEYMYVHVHVCWDCIISQLIWYSRACISYHWGLLLSKKILNQGFLV